MSEKIGTILFDVGNTLRIVIPDPEFSANAERELMELVGATETREAFFEKLERNWKAYRKHAKKTLLDASETELWLQWLLPDYPPELVAAHAGRLTRLWRDHDGRRIPRADVKSTLAELDRRGYQLGIIANTITESEIPDWMIADQVSHYFKVVILSSKVRIRKPDPEIYLLACRVLNVSPETCAYVGDNPVRDVEGAVAAGYGKMVLIHEPDTISKEKPGTDAPKPDAVIERISDLLEIFPSLNS